MNEALNSRCRLFVENRDAFKAAFPWENSYFYPVCAALFTDTGRLAEVEKMKATRALLKESVSVFSNFRGVSEICLVTMLSLDDSPKDRLEKALTVYTALKERFFGSEYLPIASMILSRAVESDRYSEICERTRRIYDLMKSEHPFLTSSEDSVFAAMLALSEKSDGDILRECETCYSLLKERFFDSNAVQSLSHVLALSDDGMRTASDKCRDTIRLFDILKERGYKYGTGYELATLGVLTMLPCGLDEVVRELIDVADFLKTQKGYGFFGLGRVQRLMHAGMIVTSEQLGGDDAMKGAAIGSNLSLIAAQQAATCAAIAASVAAANAASHSS